MSMAGLMQFVFSGISKLDIADDLCIQHRSAFIEWMMWNVLTEDRDREREKERAKAW